MKNQKKGEKIPKIRKKNRNKNQITPLIPVCSKNKNHYLPNFIKMLTKNRWFL